MTAPSAAPPARQSTPQRLIFTLGGFGALAGLLIVVAFTVTQPRIRANKAAALAAAIDEVLGAPDRYDTLYVLDNALSTTLPAGTTADQADAVYYGYHGTTPIGFAVIADGPGFQDRIRLIFGYEPSTKRMLGMKVLESKETPGLGDKIVKDTAFISQFARVEGPVVGVKAGQGKGNPNEIVMITGATISSRSLIKAINATLERVGPLLATYAGEHSQ
jgi:electron transport complex protein RnfG